MKRGLGFNGRGEVWTINLVGRLAAQICFFGYIHTAASLLRGLSVVSNMFYTDAALGMVPQRWSEKKSGVKPGSARFPFSTRFGNVTRVGDWASIYCEVTLVVHT